MSLFDLAAHSLFLDNFRYSPQPTATRRSNKYTTPARPEVAAPSSTNEPVANLVTPSDPSIDVAAIRTAVTSSPLANEHGDSKQVRFGPEDVTESPRQQNAGRGLVSRRGGRYASPGNRSVLMKTHSDDSNSVEKDEQATEYEFHSPTLKRDEVPCLSNEQRQDKSSSSSDSSSCFSASAVEANSDQPTESKALRSPTNADEAMKVRKHMPTLSKPMILASQNVVAACRTLSRLAE
jgi:hypothetical protein